jgi:hypothetical protein
MPGEELTSGRSHRRPPGASASQSAKNLIAQHAKAVPLRVRGQVAAISFLDDGSAQPIQNYLQRRERRIMRPVRPEGAVGAAKPSSANEIRDGVHRNYWIANEVLKQQDLDPVPAEQLEIATEMPQVCRSKDNAWMGGKGALERDDGAAAVHQMPVLRISPRDRIAQHKNQLHAGEHFFDACWRDL